MCARSKFARAASLEPLFLWKSVQEELQVSSVLVLCLEANLQIPRPELFYCSAALLSGGPFAMRDATDTGVTGRKPREHALSILKTAHPQSLEDEDCNCRVEFACHSRAPPLGFVRSHAFFFNPIGGCLSQLC